MKKNPKQITPKRPPKKKVKRIALAPNKTKQTCH